VVLIRAAKVEESQLILDFIIELATYEKEPDSVKSSRAQIEESFFCENPAVFCDFVETDEGDVIGFAIWFLNYSTWTGTHGIYLEDLYICPEYRDHGYGTRVLIYLAKLCIERGYHRLQWWVLDWNQSAIDFYHSIGAESMAEWTVMRVSDESLNALARRGTGD
jgi:GNAT superfamily N-acetyltransferase